MARGAGVISPEALEFAAETGEAQDIQQVLDGMAFPCAAADRRLLPALGQVVDDFGGFLDGSLRGG